MPWGFFLDRWYVLLVIPALLISVWAQISVQTTFKKYSRVMTGRGLTGAAASQLIQRQNGISVPIEPTNGSLTDHFDPRGNVIRLSEPVYAVSSVAAVGVAAHETGHALQYAQGYAMIRVRNAIIPVTRIGSTLSPYLVFFGLIFSFYPLAYLGIAFFCLAVLFQLLTLPVEFNASARALRALSSGGMMTKEELNGAKKVLTAAAMTYVAALFVSLMSLLRLILIVAGRGRQNR